MAAVATAAMVISAARMAALDAQLMSPPVGYSLSQLMELAGLSVAQAIASQYPLSATSTQRVLVAAGPGNNGGDGLVAAAHLQASGYRCTVVYPKRPTRGESKDLFEGLVTRLAQFEVPVLDAMPSAEELLASYDLLVDAVFGFSFKGEVRAPFDAILATMAAVSAASVGDASTALLGADGELQKPASKGGLPVISIDIPSGWDPDHGDPEGKTRFEPAMLVSLTAPKQCAAGFKGHHWLGGRFVPPQLAREYGIEALMALYPGADQVVKLS